jgi:hypothetical protein
MHDYIPNSLIISIRCMLSDLAVIRDAQLPQHQAQPSRTCARHGEAQKQRSLQK